MNRLAIAQFAHIINAAYCAALGDTSQPSWEEAPQWQKDSALAGVDMHLANPDATPEQSHESWLEHKVADGWTYGPVKDETAKTHPCCLPYADLPVEQKAKDFLFRAVVHAAKDLPDAGDLQQLQEQIGQLKAQLAAAATTSGAPLALEGVAIEYIGHKPVYIDRLYKTGLEFAKGDVKILPAVTARQFLRHTDMFRKADAEQAAAADPELAAAIAGKIAEQSREEVETEKRERDVADLHQQISQMNMEALNELGSRYGLKFTKSNGLAKARAELSNTIDRLGVL